MNSKDEIRSLTLNESLNSNEIDVSEHVDILETLCKRARKDYYRAIKQKVSPKGALACALGTQRAYIVKENTNG